MDCYEKDFEEHMLRDTGNYYSCKVSNWILSDSCPDYMIKAEECLEKERDKSVSLYAFEQRAKIGGESRT